MTTLHLEPDHARQLARLLKSNAAEIQLSADTLERAFQRLNNDWISSRAISFYASSIKVSKTLFYSADELMHLASSMEYEIDEWVATDENGRRIFQMPLSAAVLLLGMTGGGNAIAVSWKDGWLGDTGLSEIRLPAGFSLASLATLVSPIPQWLEDWMGSMFGKTEGFSPVVDDPVVVMPTVIGDEDGIQPHVSFGDLIAKEADAGQAMPSSSLEYDVPVISQGNLYGNAACLPTSVAMVTGYFHNQNAANTAISAETLIGVMDKGDGTYGRGVGIDKLNDEIAAYGYKEPVIKVNASLEDLKGELATGPVIVNTGVKISLAGGVRSLAGEGNTNHSIVVTGISQDGSQITVNDPWSGKQLDYSTEDFNKIWTRGQNIMTSIRPAV